LATVVTDLLIVSLYCLFYFFHCGCLYGGLDIVYLFSSDRQHSEFAEKAG